jgi:hypothetical protein
MHGESFMMVEKLYGIFDWSFYLGIVKVERWNISLVDFTL